MAETPTTRESSESSEKSSTTELEATAVAAAATPVSSISEHEKELAIRSFQKFEKGDYEACMGTLKKLMTSRHADVKVRHNRAVLEYFLSGLNKTEEFRKKLADVCKQAHVNIEDVDTLDDADHCVMFFNQAVILFHLRQYHAAIAILDKLFQFIEPLDEHLARKVCFLLLELYLSTHQPEKALGLVAYVENMLFGSSKGSGKGSSPEKDGKDREGSKEKDITELNLNELHRPKLQHYKARCYIMLKSTKACKREIKSLINSGVSVPAVFLRSQLEYLRNNHRKALKLMNTVFSSGTCRPFDETGDNIATMYYNNVGCIHFYMDKPHLAGYYFVKALEEHENALRSVANTENTNGEPLNSRPVHMLDNTVCYQILYNLGLQFLHAGEPNKAFDCLIEAVQVFHTNPCLWLRLAECCIQAHKAAGSQEFQLKERKKDMVQGAVGSGPHKKLILAPYVSNDNKLSSQEQSSAMPAVTLEFASLCLRNALLLIPGEQTTASGPSNGSDDQDTGNQPEANVVNQAPAGVPKRDTGGLKDSVLAASAYVALCMGNTLVGLKYAETLLAQPKISGAHRLLGHLYAAEALILLDRIGDAIQHLNPEHVGDVSLSFPSDVGENNNKNSEEVDNNSGHAQTWYPNSVPLAKIIMQYNLAVAYTLRGELEKASETLRQVGVAKGPDIPVQVIMLVIYIQLQQGLADLAKNIIKQHLPQYRL